MGVATAKAVETPWSRSMAQVGQSGMYFADASLRDVQTPFLSLSMNSETTEKLFARRLPALRRYRPWQIHPAACRG